MELWPSDAAPIGGLVTPVGGLTWKKRPRDGDGTWTLGPARLEISSPQVPTHSSTRRGNSGRVLLWSPDRTPQKRKVRGFTVEKKQR